MWIHVGKQLKVPNRSQWRQNTWAIRRACLRFSHYILTSSVSCSRTDKWHGIYLFYTIKKWKSYRNCGSSMCLTSSKSEREWSQDTFSGKLIKITYLMFNLVILLLYTVLQNFSYPQALTKIWNWLAPELLLTLNQCQVFPEV